MSDCPKCKCEIGNASYCGCGWKKPKGSIGDRVDAAPIPCARIGCETPATERVKTPSGWTNYCRKDADAYHRAGAEENCERLGLKTVAEMRAYVLGKVRIEALRRIFREPGQDDGERAA